MISNITTIRVFWVYIALLNTECFEKQMTALCDPLFAGEASKPQKGGKEKKEENLNFLVRALQSLQDYSHFVCIVLSCSIYKCS